MMPSDQNSNKNSQENPSSKTISSIENTVGPPRIEYVVAKHVAILDEHPMTGDEAGAAQYCGPEELQLIADNNNGRISATGDATPIVIGHTVDGDKEKNQPELVGFALNFETGPLFDTGRQALFADFHIRKDKVKEVNKYPRRSVELWPKRWEIDPISLLGATTPERDLGLLQLHRNDVPIRYNRTFNNKSSMFKFDDLVRYSHKNEEPSMADMKDPKPAESAGGGGGEGKNAALVQEVLQSAPIVQMQETLQQLLSLLQGGGEDEAAAPSGQSGMTGPGGPDEEGAMPPDGGAQQEEETAPGGHEGNAAWMHEGSPERYAEMMNMHQEHVDQGGWPNDAANNVNGDEGTDANMHNQPHMCYGQGCSHPSHSGSSKMSHKETQEKYAAFASSMNDYIPSNGESKVKKSRKSSNSDWMNWIASLEQGDKAIMDARDKNRVAALEKQVNDLTLAARKYARAEQLRALQQMGYDLEVAEEIQQTMNDSDEKFTGHLETIKKRYQRDPSKLTFTELQPDGKPAAVAPTTSPESRMNSHQKIMYSRRIAEIMGEKMHDTTGMTSKQAEKEAVEQANKELQLS